MALKQLNPIERLIFLKKFAAELIINSKKPEPEKKENDKKLKIEKLKQKFFKPIDSKEFEKSINTPIFQKPIYPRFAINLPSIQKTPPSPKKSLKPLIKPLQKPKEKSPSKNPLEKLSPLIKDPLVQSIECPGPGKNILVKRYNGINITKITLSQEEITAIINDFSEKAKIPITGGILKAAVGSLIISAVISEFVGSRFIINKIMPSF